MLAFNDGGALRIGAELHLEVFENGALWDAKRLCHVWQVRDVGLHTVETTLLLEAHLRHLVPVVRVVILRLRDANVPCHDWLVKIDWIYESLLMGEL